MENSIGDNMTIQTELMARREELNKRIDELKYIKIAEIKYRDTNITKADDELKEKEKELESINTMLSQ